MLPPNWLRRDPGRGHPPPQGSLPKPRAVLFRRSLRYLLRARGARDRLQMIPRGLPSIPMIRRVCRNSQRKQGIFPSAGG